MLRKNIMKGTSYTVVPLHERIELTPQCCKLVNSEWPRSEVARLRSLNSSCDKFPTCLLLLDDTYVVGHCKISLVPNMSDSCFIESVIIDQRYRARGLGTMLMQGAEEYVAKRGIINVFLSTKGQEYFYKKIGYKICDPVSLYGNSYITGNGLPPIPKQVQKDLRSNGPSPPPMPIIRNSGFPFSTAKTYMVKNM
ncbi:N-alpha-acetyltransferase 80-like isoform X1 [Diprion similis]|uniref:N-alpha-acetyltransferase 80-like isoform X1 n=2 Tax=Diprion similis TaxID=362088 RepID=UPI001EF8EA0D|nr:N-alpha-acetyltransferase 80-like isoform X1 [Diprion similis]